MKLIVWEIGAWKTSKFSGFLTQRVMFKSLDETDRKTYYLNIDQKWPQFEQWLPLIKKGNILDVTLQPNGNNISLFHAPTAIKEVKNAS